MKVEGARTAVRTNEGNSDSFEVKVGLHQGSVRDCYGCHLSRLEGRTAMGVTLC